jgi:hypothetical protein
MRRELADKSLHPNAAGYAVMVSLAARAIEQSLARVHGRKQMRRLEPEGTDPFPAI